MDTTNRGICVGCNLKSHQKLEPSFSTVCTTTVCCWKKRLFMQFWLVYHIFRGFGGNAVSQIKGLLNWFFGFEHFDYWVPQCLSWAYIPLFHWGMSKTCLRNHFSIYKARHQLPLFYSSLNKKPKQSQLWKEFHLCATKTVDTINCCSLVKVESSRLKAVVWWLVGTLLSKVVRVDLIAMRDDISVIRAFWEMGLSLSLLVTDASLRH